MQRAIKYKKGENSYNTFFSITLGFLDMPIILSRFLSFYSTAVNFRLFQA